MGERERGERSCVFMGPSEGITGSRRGKENDRE
jgi:hypothetical protein